MIGPYWDDATNPDIPDAQLSPQARALRDTFNGRMALLHAHLRRLGTIILDAHGHLLRRIFDWLGRWPK